MVLMAGILRWFKLEWWMASGRVDYKRGRYQAALQSFQQLVALYPQHLLAQSYVGACYMSLKQYDDAVLAFELRRALLEAVSHRRAIARHIVGMHTPIPVFGCQSGSLETENLHQAGRDKKRI